MSKKPVRMELKETREANIQQTSGKHPSDANQFESSPIKANKENINQVKLSQQRFDNKKKINPFSSNAKHKTNFGYVYQNNGLPIRLLSGNIHLKIEFDQDIADIEQDPLLVHCFEGLMEDKHPLDFIAEECSVQLLSDKSARSKTTMLVKKLVPLLRLCFESTDLKVQRKGLRVLTALSNCIKNDLDIMLGFLLSQINKRVFDKSIKEEILTVLAVIEKNGDSKTIKQIKSKIPTQNSIM